jgi:hypothetical protein
MDQLRNPQLGEMSTDDLNQRYCDTHCLYFGEPKYIYGFVADGGKILIDIGDINTGTVLVKQDRVPFRWEGLNVARPYAGWYMFNKGDTQIPFHLSYPVKRQYKRGLQAKNTNLLIPSLRAPSGGCYFHAALTAPEPVFTPITDDTFRAERTVIPRPDRLLLWDGLWSFFFKTRNVAQINLKDNKLFILQPGFEQELFEVGRSGILDNLQVVEALPPEPKKAPKAVGDRLREILNEHGVRALDAEDRWHEVDEPEDEHEEDVFTFSHDEDVRMAIPRLRTLAAGPMIGRAIRREERPARFLPIARVEWNDYPLGGHGFGTIWLRETLEGDIADWRLRHSILWSWEYKSPIGNWLFHLFTRNDVEPGDERHAYILTESFR